jgi:hypothetical protein
MTGQGLASAPAHKSMKALAMPNSSFGASILTPSLAWRSRYCCSSLLAWVLTSAKIFAMAWGSGSALLSIDLSGVGLFIAPPNTNE